jgi:hypothetical protein
MNVGTRVCLVDLHTDGIQYYFGDSRKFFFVAQTRFARPVCVCDIGIGSNASGTSLATLNELT